METGRAGIDETISAFDLHDTYLPQYGIAFQEGRAGGVMCSYNEVDGVPMCANQVRRTTRPLVTAGSVSVCLSTTAG